MVGRQPVPADGVPRTDIRRISWYNHDCRMSLSCQERLLALTLDGPVERNEEVTMPNKQRPNQDPPLRKHQRTHSEDGVDLTLIRWMLSLTPEQRIRALEDNVYALMRLKNGTITA